MALPELPRHVPKQSQQASKNRTAYNIIGFYVAQAVSSRLIEAQASGGAIGGIFYAARSMHPQGIQEWHRQSLRSRRRRQQTSPQPCIASLQQHHHKYAAFVTLGRIRHWRIASI